MAPLNIFVIFFVFQISNIHAHEVVCTLEDYILTGIEFRRCQQEALQSFESGQSEHSCSIIRQIVESCSKIVQRCFSPRGWERGQLVFVDLLALQYPDQNHCDVFIKRKNSTVPEKLPDEKCSILEEVSLLTNMRVCNNKVQTEIANIITHTHHDKVNVSDPQMNHWYKHALLQEAYPMICAGLQNISDTCFVPNLSQCYDSHDAHFHFVYMLEELKSAGIVLAMHLLSNTSTINILQCPVFSENSPFADNSSKATIIVLAVFLTLFVLTSVISIMAFITLKFRLVPRARAWLHDKPYEDVTNEMTVVPSISENRESRDDLENARNSAQQPLPSLEELKGVATQNAVANLRDQSETSGQST